MSNALIVIVAAGFIVLATCAAVIDYGERRACWDQGLIPAEIDGAGIKCIAASAIEQEGK
ncbi:hypothetical protein [uncultured Salipiger sp.]|uniref:hypothetical protein n=1 Tax=uncultured Salipiger sp. TaxID=499810 RepID=UPI00259A9568|nr:hypothetical protein [uncultured Salipiger sp.]